MFTVPPLPPKDYILKHVNQNQFSHPDLTPVALPRVTQTTLAKFCAPLEYKDNEKVANWDLGSVNDRILQRWTQEARAFWVDKPGKNDFFLHDMFKTFNVETNFERDQRFKHNERVFYRSFKYELECMEEERLKCLYKKMQREDDEEKEKIKIIEEKNTKVDTMGVKACKEFVPFWWKEEKPGRCDDFKLKTGSVDYQATNLRWQEEPSLTDYIKSDPCKRRTDLALIGLPFRNEACNWYYHNYPPPNIRFIHKRFT